MRRAKRSWERPARVFRRANGVANWGILMRSAGNFSPEWGYLAPTPSLARTARVVLVATAIGATAGAGVVLSLVERPAEAQKMPIATRAIVTSVRETAVPSVAPAVGTAAVTSAATGVSAAPTPAPTPVAASASPPVLKLGASTRTAVRLPLNGRGRVSLTAGRLSPSRGSM